MTTSGRVWGPWAQGLDCADTWDPKAGTGISGASCPTGWGRPGVSGLHRSWPPASGSCAS